MIFFNLFYLLTPRERIQRNQTTPLNIPNMENAQNVYIPGLFIDKNVFNIPSENRHFWHHSLNPYQSRYQINQEIYMENI